MKESEYSHKSERREAGIDGLGILVVLVLIVALALLVTFLALLFHA